MSRDWQCLLPASGALTLGTLPLIEPRKYTGRKVNTAHAEAMQKGSKAPQATAPAEFPAWGQRQLAGMEVRTLDQLSAQAIITQSRRTKESASRHGESTRCYCFNALNFRGLCLFLFLFLRKKVHINTKRLLIYKTYIQRLKLHAVSSL